MNRFAFGDAYEYDAIVDRGQFIFFDPSSLEIHKNTALWFWDQEIFDFIGTHLQIIDSRKLSARAYIKAYERKPKGDWKEFISRRYFTQSGEQWILALESDTKYKSVEERVAEFVLRTGLGRSTYFNIKKTLKVDGQFRPVEVPRFTLTGKSPEAAATEAETKEAEEEKRRAEDGAIEEQEEREYREMEDRVFGEDHENDDGKENEDDGE